MSGDQLKLKAMAFQWQEATDDVVVNPFLESAARVPLVVA